MASDYRQYEHEYKWVFNMFSPSPNNEANVERIRNLERCGCRVFYVDYKDEDAWLEAAGAEEYILSSDGSLIDNFMVSCDDGVVAVFEEYVSAWSSRHRFVWADRGDDKAVEAVYDEWYSIIGENEDEYDEEVWYGNGAA